MAAQILRKQHERTKTNITKVVRRDSSQAARISQKQHVRQIASSTDITKAARKHAAFVIFRYKWALYSTSIMKAIRIVATYLLIICAAFMIFVFASVISQNIAKAAQKF
jgi:hypothetical protein